MNYQEFIAAKSQLGGDAGFEPDFIPPQMFDFQRHLTTWALGKGRSLLLEDCGLGKTLQYLTWAENIVRRENKPVLVVTPLAVAAQTVQEGEKFGIECHRSNDGRVKPNITVTNYERLHHFDPGAFVGVVCDESSAIKNFAGERQKIVTEFLREMPYRLLCTATAAPNDYIELGTSASAQCVRGFMKRGCYDRDSPQFATIRELSHGIRALAGPDGGTGGENTKISQPLNRHHMDRAFRRANGGVRNFRTHR